MALSCPSCQSPMAALALDGHLGRTVTIDLCRSCQAFWFDDRESLQLTPGATLRLFREIGQSATERSMRPPASLTGHCPRCSMRLKPMHDMQRETKFQYLACPARHGRLMSFVDFLREKNFLVPLSADELERLRRNVQTVNCSNCGATIDLARSTACAHCGSALSMLDVQHAESLIAQLRAADAGKATIDPALPLNLLSARRDVSAAFDDFESRQRWFDKAAPHGNLVQAGINVLQRLLK